MLIFLAWMGLAHLPEVRPTGYYRDTPATALVVGDIVLVYRRENVEHESELVYILNFEDVYYDNVQVQHEGEYVKDFDTTAEQRVIWIGNPVGSGEFTDVTDISDSIDDLTTGQTTVFNVYDERDGGGGAGAGDACWCMPVPATTPVGIVTYTAGEVFTMDRVTAAGGAATADVGVFGFLNDA